MSPTQHSRTGAVSQAESRKKRRPRHRKCLLKGCERRFLPDDPAERYCSNECRRKAAQWQRWRRQRTYRRTQNGKAHRREQSRRYRIRRRERKRRQAADVGGEGNARAADLKKVTCARPGCYQCFEPHLRSPSQRFCSPLCRKALRRVLIRERRWGLPERKGYNRPIEDDFMFRWRPRNR